MNIYDRNGFHWFIGVIEDRMDPEKIGRVKIRIFGYHNIDKGVTGVPTEDLPWAVPIMPITSASISGIGAAPLGPVEGSWAFGFFLDGSDCQQPAYMGTIPTTVASKVFADYITGPSSSGVINVPRPSSAAGGSPIINANNLQNKNDGIVKDSNGQPVLDENKNPIRTGSPSIPGWELGNTSEKYESGGKGPGTINNYLNSGDFGGASYGTYQLASFLPAIMPDGKSRPNSKNSPVKNFLAVSKFKDKFSGLEPGTSQFDNVWKSISSSNSKEFKKDQHDFIKNNYYDVMISNLKRKGLDLTSFGPAVQDLIWSTSVQFGPTRTTIFTVPLEGKSKLTDKDIVELISNYKIQNVNEFFKSSSDAIKSGAKSRFVSEKNDLLKLIT